MATVGLFSILGNLAMAQEDPFADVVETRLGLMMRMPVDMAKMGAMV
ncbi:MAG: hypothetical protein H7245_20940 [Candidatus Saccharibacteria bacterium]|nr:hypothetical protein [Pseudorhodobacter sp.]